MKKIDFFCASPASTAICSSLDHRSSVRHGHRPINHYHHHRRSLDDQRNTGKVHIPSTISQLPINRKPNFYNETKHRKSTRSKPSRKSSADIDDLVIRPSSSRYLLSDSQFIDVISESQVSSEKAVKIRDLSIQEYGGLIKSSSVKPRFVSTPDHESPSLKSLQSASSANSRSFSTPVSPALKLCSVARDGLSSQNSPALRTSSSSRSGNDQVVVLMVSIHCKGCEGKVRKHISKMEGVKSFSIDLATKRVTVIGDVTPLGVLASVSKVKYAQFWPSPTSTLSSSSPSS